MITPFNVYRFHGVVLRGPSLSAALCCWRNTLRVKGKALSQDFVMVRHVNTAIARDGLTVPRRRGTQVACSRELEFSSRVGHCIPG
jgi:hypothetical protein